MKGLACLAKATVVIYDRLLDERLLDSVRPETERIYVGKAGGQHTREQREDLAIAMDINRETLRHELL